MNVGKVLREYEVLESIHDAVVVSDRDGKIVYVNRQAERLTGYRRIELIGRGVEVRSSPACARLTLSTGAVSTRVAWRG